MLEEARGPFEPLVSSTGSPSPPAPEAAEPAAQPPGTQASQAPGADDGPDDPAGAQARRLEQIKDFYLTAEAIGEQNVDKHFDQLLAQQRELISEYFKQAGPRDGDRAPAEAGPDGRDEPDESGPPGDQTWPPAGASFVAEPPRVW